LEFYSKHFKDLHEENSFESFAMKHKTNPIKDLNTQAKYCYNVPLEYFIDASAN